MDTAKLCPNEHSATRQVSYNLRNITRLRTIMRAGLRRNFRYADRCFQAFRARDAGVSVVRERCLG